jgi:two-component system, NtrC family, response regulator AtoC
MRGMQEIEWIGVSGGVAALRDEMELCSRTDAKVLITADSGVDRALIARTIHDRSVRSARRFTRVNCADASESVLEARIFGQSAGRHSEPARSRAGAIELAHGGTVFLNEVGDLSPRLQALLLGYLETGDVRRVGSVDARAVNARVIAATSRTLADRVRSGWFREDLFYRLNLIHIVVPPLAERREDVPVIVEYLLHKLSSVARRPPAISPRAMALLSGYPWPGNVRELRLVLEKLAAATHGDVAEADDLPARIRLWQPGTAVAPSRPLHGSRR